MTAQPTRPPRNAFEREARKVYRPLGFQKGYNFILWFIFGGALFGFCLSRMKYFNFDGQFCPDELNFDSGPALQCYWVKIPRYRVGTLLHLVTVLPAGVLAVFQFVPAIRHRFILYHRIAGYLIVLLIVLGNVGAVMIADRALGGDLTTQTMVGFIAIATTITFGLALYNIKMLQIEHGCYILMAVLISIWPYKTLYDTMTCDELAFLYRNNTRVEEEYPSCVPGNAAFTSDGHVAVKAQFGHGAGQTMASFDTSFAAAGTMAFVLHAIGVEVYLRLTPREGERLRQISYERQLERKFKHPGSAGLVADRLGDSDTWRPRVDSADSEVVSVTEDSKENKPF